MDTDTCTKAQIVDLLRYKAERGQRSLNFVGNLGDNSDGPPARPRAHLAAVRPFRPLTTRELAHRQQMVKHLDRSRRV